MWQRFTERTRRVIFFAQEEAARLGQNYVGTEHLLLGLLREDDSLTVRVLERSGVSPSRVRQEIKQRIERGDGRLRQEMQLTPSAKKVIDLAYEEARQMRHKIHIGTEHLLLGLIREPDGLGGRVLRDLGLVLDEVRLRSIALEVASSKDQPVEPEIPSPSDAEASREISISPIESLIPPEI